MVAPYVARRKGAEIRALTGVRGKVIGGDTVLPLEPLVFELTGVHSEKISPILPVRVSAGFGLAAREDGEAFIVPDGWCIPNSHVGPALNDMDEQRRRLKSAGFPCLRRIFDVDSAELLIQSLRSAELGIQAQSREFQFHEAGHAAGLGLRRKISSNLLKTPWYRAVEEWRADGVEFALLRQSLSPEDAGRVVAANFVLRFGIDAQRVGGTDRDTDVNAALLTFDRLIESGFVRMTAKKKLSFRDHSYSALLKAVEPHASQAVQLTRDELALDFEEGLWGLYGSISLSKASRILFNGSVTQPCKGLFKNLQ